MCGRRRPPRFAGTTRGVGPLAAACVAVACWSPHAAAAEQAPAARRVISDPAVTQAGGVCRGCRDAHCRSCRLRGHHDTCRDGTCHPHCPVRPQEFGFYNTQWRRWPGQGVVPVTNLQDATPDLPPKSAVPGADEESRGPQAGDLPAPEPEADAAAPPATQPTDSRPAEPSILPADEPAPLEPLEPAAPSRENPADAEPVAPAPPAAEPPAEEPAAKEPATGDVFDESATGPVRRRFVAKRLVAEAAQPVPAPVRPATLTYPASAEQELPPPPAVMPPRATRVPRVPFDPADPRR